MKLFSLTTVVACLWTSVLARSSVSLIKVPSVDHTPEVSLDTFSQFYANMMDTQPHPALRFQDDDNAIHSFLPASNDVFEKKVDGSLVVVVAGVQDPQAILSQETSFYVSDDEPDHFVSMVQDTVYQMTDTTIATYNYEETEIRQETDAHFQHDFDQFKTELFDVRHEADALLIHEVEDIYQQKQKDVNVIQVHSLQAMADTYGVESEQYKEAQLILNYLFETIVIPNFQQQYSRGVSLFVFTPAMKQSMKRDVLTDAQVCYATASACKNNTSYCHGHGQCVKVDKNCYACQCQSSYVGESCQYVNAVSDFQLLFWTSVLLIVITASVVVCVYQSGDIVDGGIVMTQSVPKQE